MIVKIKIIFFIFYFLSKLGEYFYYGTCKNKPINAGTYIGYSKDLLSIIKKTYSLDPNNSADDQILLTKYCNSSNDVDIDIDNNIFLCFASPYSNIDNIVINNNTVIYKNNTPFFLHGPGQTYLDNTIKLLGYKFNDDNLKKKMIKKELNKLIFNIKNNLFIFLLILYLLFIIIKKIYSKFNK